MKNSENSETLKTADPDLTLNAEFYLQELDTRNEII